MTTDSDRPGPAPGRLAYRRVQALRRRLGRLQSQLSDGAFSAASVNWLRSEEAALRWAMSLIRLCERAVTTLDALESTFFDEALSDKQNLALDDVANLCRALKAHGMGTTPIDPTQEEGDIT